MTTQTQEQAIQAYEQWLSSQVIDEASKDELHGIRNNEHEIVDRFYKELEFGTGGLRVYILNISKGSSAPRSTLESELFSLAHNLLK
ncbi:hypothetical protein [Paenibacillus taichungensis]|uniref:hypothetical protein n=1 Tax=Paenibacillus taichungensis TaxID=484184 RepID=UPI0039A56CB2